MTRPARRAVTALRWRILGAALGCLVAAATMAWLGNAHGSRPVSIERTTSAVPPPVLTDSGPPPGPLLPLWTITTAAVPGLSPPGEVGYGIVDGQLALVSPAGLDIRDARTGGRRWHYYRTGWMLTGWASTGTEIAALFERPPGGATARTLVALDAATGQTLWQSQRDEPVGVVPSSLRWLSGPGVFLVSTDAHLVRGVDSRSGRTRWSRPLPAGCSLAPPAPEAAGGDDAAVDLLAAVCRAGRRVLAVRPVDGAVLWSVASPGTTAEAISVQHGISALWDGESLRLIRADGSVVLRAHGNELCGDVCPIAVAGGRVLLDYSPDGTSTLLQAFDLGSGRPAWRRPAAAYEAMADAGGRVYALSNMLADGLLPAAVDVIDPLRGQLTSVPLPLAFRSGAGDPPGLAAAGGLLIAGYPLEFAGPAGGYRVVALRSGPEGPGPAVLGGTPASQWPDTCALVSSQELAAAIPTAGYARIPGQVDLPGLRLRTGCDYEPSRAGGEAAGVDVSIGWVAATSEQAMLLLADVRATYQQAEPLPGLGDEAYDLGMPAGQVAVRVGRVIIMVRADQSAGAATELARAAVLGLRRAGF